MRDENKKSFFNKAINFDLSYFAVVFIALTFTYNALEIDEHTESYAHLINIVFWSIAMIILSRGRIKESDELGKRIELEIVHKTYSIIMPILFCAGYGILKFAKLHHEAKIIGLVFTIFFTVQMIVRIIVNKKYS